MKRFPWLMLALLATAAAFAAEPTPAELGVRATAFLQNGRDVHVIQTGFFLDGGSKSATLADATGARIGVIILNQRRARQAGAIFGAFDPVHHREYIPTGDDQAVFKAALVAALRRSQVSNPATRRLLDALTSWFPTYGDDLHWSATRDDPLITGPRVAMFGGAVVVLAVALALSISRRKRRPTPVGA